MAVRRPRRPLATPTERTGQKRVRLRLPLDGRVGTVSGVEDRIAWHAGRGFLDDFPEYTNKLNHYSIGIEFLAIGSRDEMAPKYLSRSAYDRLDPGLIGYTEVQYTAVNELLAEIYNRHPAIVRDRRHVIGHDEYAGIRQRPNDPKVDPGSLFDWDRVMM